MLKVFRGRTVEPYLSQSQSPRKLSTLTSTVLGPYKRKKSEDYPILSNASRLSSVDTESYFMVVVRDW